MRYNNRSLLVEFRVGLSKQNQVLISSESLENCTFSESFNYIFHDSSPGVLGVKYQFLLI